MKNIRMISALWVLILSLGCAHSRKCPCAESEQEQPLSHVETKSESQVLAPLSFRDPLPMTGILLDRAQTASVSDCELTLHLQPGHYLIKITDITETTLFALPAGKYQMETRCTTAPGNEQETKSAAQREFEVRPVGKNSLGSLVYLGTLDVTASGTPEWQTNTHPHSKDLTISIQAKDRKRISYAETGKAIFF